MALPLLPVPLFLAAPRAARHNSDYSNAARGIATKLPDQLRDSICRKHRSPATEQAHVGWCQRFLSFIDRRHPKDMGEVEIHAFPTDPAVAR